jgi:glutamate N-acetyltransferase/amino-acid N-acetyltransferase
VLLAGMAKGAGMICPDMATMLCVVLCDAAVDKAAWTGIVQSAVARTFNRVTVDGDTSTNDTIYALANGCSGVAALSPADLAALSAGLEDVLGRLAYMLVQDGEGASKVAHITVTGAASDADAEQVARAVGQSPLVKTALYGRDPNWGRIAMAVGRSGVKLTPEKVRISLCGVEMFRDAQPVDMDVDATFAGPLKERDVPIAVVLGDGPGSYTLLASDLGHEYVDCNASYRT